MTATLQATRRPKIHRSYLALLRRFPLRAIRSEAEYAVAGELLNELVLVARPDPGQRDYLSALELVIEAYDKEHFDLGADERSPHQRLVSLLGSSGTTPAQLQRILGVSQALVSLMLSGRRALSKRTIAALSDHFHVDPGYFL